LCAFDFFFTDKEDFFLYFRLLYLYAENYMVLYNFSKADLENIVVIKLRQEGFLLQSLARQSGHQIVGMVPLSEWNIPTHCKPVDKKTGHNKK
jgi:hypothetical protein